MCQLRGARILSGQAVCPIPESCNLPLLFPGEAGSAFHTEPVCCQVEVMKGHLASHCDEWW